MITRLFLHARLLCGMQFFIYSSIPNFSSNVINLTLLMRSPIQNTKELTRETLGVWGSEEAPPRTKCPWVLGSSEAP